MIRTMMSGGASVEETLELWASSLRGIKERIRPLFTQERVAASAARFLDVLLGNEPRKTGWMRAEAAGDPGPWRQQALLGRGTWDADALRDIVREYAVEQLCDDKAVLVIDETGFLKQGKASCGVARQYTGSAGKITNCQIGVFAAYVSDKGHAFIDRALYLPKAWTSDSARMRAARVPETVGFATKPVLAVEMIERALAAHVPFAWVAADSVYGVGDIEAVLRLSAGQGTKGERLYDWAYSELADLDASEYDEHRTGLWTRGLLIRRNPTDSDMAYFTTCCPKGTSIETLVRAEGTRWRIEEGFETAKNELGPDHNETRSWHGWHRHVSLVMLGLCHDGCRPTSSQQHAEKNEISTTKELIRWSVQEIRRLAFKLAQRQIKPAHILAWSVFRRAHQAAARRSHLKSKMQL